MHNQYRKKRGFLKNCIFMMCLIFLILSGFKPGHAEASWLTKFINDVNEEIEEIFTGGADDTTSAGTNTGTYTYTNTNTQTNTYTNTVNGEVVTSSENKITRYTVTTMVDGVEQTGTIADDGIMLAYDDGGDVMSYLIPGDGQMLFLQEQKPPLPESGDEATLFGYPSPFRGLTLKTVDDNGNYVDVGNDSSLVDPSRKPVVITHGKSSNYEDVLTLGDKYDPAKYQVFYADYGSYWGIDDIAAGFADKVNNNLLQFYPDKISIVFEQHSMGAAVVYSATAKGLVDMNKIDAAVMISIAPLYGSYGQPEYLNFLLSLWSQSFAQGNTAAFFNELGRNGLPENVKHIVIGTLNDETNSMEQQRGFESDGFFPVTLTGHVEILTDEVVDNITDLYWNYGGTFIQKIGNWNISYEHGRITTLYYDNFYELDGEGLVLLTDDTGNFTGQFSTYIGSYPDGNINEPIFVDERFYPITYNPDGSWDQEAMFGFGSIHSDAEGIDTEYTITTGEIFACITPDDTEQSYTALYREVPGQLAGAALVDSSSDTTPPTTPGAPTASSPNTAKFTLTWTASTDANGIDKYLVYRGIDGSGNVSLIATVTTNSYDESDLPAGKYRYSVTAVDKAGWGSNSPTSAVIEVVKVNRRPILSFIGDKTVSERDNVVFTVSATDPDGDPKWYYVKGLPAGATFGNRTFSWTPTLSQVGNYNVTFSVTDGLSSDKETITIEVIENRPPVFALGSNRSVNEGVKLTFGVHAADTYGSRLVYSATGLPSGATFKADPNTYYWFNWTPTFTQAGSYAVTFNVTDSIGLSDSETITITVNNVNRAPVLEAIGTKTINEGALLSFNVSATDADGDVVTYSATGLPAGATFSGQTFNWTPSFSQSGSYSVTFIVSDGTLSDSEKITIASVNVPVPDLITSSLSIISGVMAAPGDSFFLENTVLNQGTVAAGSFTAAFSLSKDANYGGTDDIAFSATRSVTSLDKGANSSASTSLTVLTTIPGSYYVCAMADSGNTVSETKEVNNGRCTTSTIKIVLPDLVMTAVYGPTSAAPGTSVSLDSTVRNQGVGGVGSFPVGFYLSTDTAITTADTWIGARSISSLAAGASSSATTSVTIPTTIAAGTYYIGVIADYNNTRAESNETNNAMKGNTIKIVLPDLVMTAVYGPTSAAPGTSVSLDSTVRNQGVGGVGSFPVGFYLSTDTAITTADTWIGARSISSLAAGASSSATTSVTIPPTVAGGTYYIGAIADYENIRAESNETNNAMRGNTIRIVLTDLITSSLSTAISGVVVTPGDNYSLRNTVRNQGMAAAGSFTVAFSLSKDAVYGGTDDIAFTRARTVSGLNAGADSSDETSLTVPTTTQGSYYVCARADSGNIVSETDEANNGRCTSSTITVVLPDLVMTKVSGPASTVTGASVDIVNMVKNQGIGSAGRFYVALYLSTDAAITTADTIVGTRHFWGLSSGVTDSATTRVTIPTTLSAGTYYIGAIADYNSTLAETNETNNALSGNTVIITIGADLVMTAVSGPSSGTKGASISISNTVKNQGTGGAASFIVGLYLSTDPNITTTDLRLGTRSVGSLAAGASSSATTSVTIPTTVAAGTYYVGAVADYANTAVESNETNNARAGNVITVQ